MDRKKSGGDIYINVDMCTDGCCVGEYEMEWIKT